MRCVQSCYSGSFFRNGLSLTASVREPIFGPKDLRQTPLVPALISSAHNRGSAFGVKNRCPVAPLVAAVPTGLRYRLTNGGLMPFSFLRRRAVTYTPPDRSTPAEAGRETIPV
ncbi:hypothetical protein LNQ03_03425 [Klebsiella pneumoniae subsp. pneumoniae]|nr:hypothetical protein [Klebsiella pneumoniae subsp. pneumoniae]